MNEIQSFEIDLSSENRGSLLKSTERQGADFKQGFYIMIKSHFGLSLLTLPYVAVHGGYIMTPILIMLTNFMLTKTMNLLCEVATAIPYDTQTFGNVINIYLGEKADQLISMLLISGSIGTCVAYLIFFQIFAQNLLSDFGIETHTFQIFILCLAITIPFSYLKTVTRLSSFTKYGFYVCGTIIMCNILYNFQIILTDKPTHQIITFDLSRFIETYGIIMAIYPYIIFFSVRNALAHPEKDLKTVIQYCNTTSLITQLLYSLSHIMIYSQSQISQIALYNLPKNYFIQSIFAFAYGATLLINFPITLNGAIQAIEIQVKTGVYNAEVTPPNMLPIKSLIIRTTLVLFISFLAFVVPSLSKWLASIGLIKANIFSVLFPVTLHYLQNKNASGCITTQLKLQYILFTLIGIIGLCLGLIEFVKMFV